MSLSPIGLQSQTFWGLIFQLPVLKIGLPNVGYEPFAPQGEALGFEFPPDCGSLHQDGVYGEIVSQPFPPASMWFLSGLGDVEGLALPVFRLLSEEIVVYVAVDFSVSVEEVRSGSSILNWNPNILFFT